MFLRRKKELKLECYVALLLMCLYKATLNRSFLILNLKALFTYFITLHA